MFNLSIMLEDSARDHPDYPALILELPGSPVLSLTYAEVEAKANQVANLLAERGIGPGDNVALSCPNLPDFAFAYYGILKTGATVVPLNVLLQAREIAYHLRDSEAKAYFCFDGTPDLPMGERGRAAFDDVDETEHFFGLPTPEAEGMPVEFESVQTSPDDTAVILYTSGTTGQPKGAELSHLNMALNAMVSDEMFDSAPENVMLAALPLFHSFGQTVIMNMGFRRAAAIVLLPRFDPRAALALMRKHEVTFFAGVPTMYWAMLEVLRTEPRPESLRTLVSGGSALPMEVLTGIEKSFGIDVLEGYGMSETSPVATFNRPDRASKPGSIGRPIWGVECKLVGDDWSTVEGEGPGELAIRGHLVMKRYYNRPEATAEVLRDGWLRTGDVAIRDEDGFYYIVDRAKDMIIRGGFNVYPREVEEVLMTHEAVSLAAVVGEPHGELGEEVKAYIVLESGATTTAADLIAWAAETMAAHKYPRTVEFRDTLPMTATGKILKRELR